MSRRPKKSDYDAWWKTLSPAQKEAMLATGYDPDMPHLSGVPKPFRYLETDKDSSADGCDGHRDWKDYADWSQRGYDVDHQRGRQWQAERAQEEQLMIEQTFSREQVLDIISKAMSVFTDSVNPAVRLHGTCVNIALGVPGQPNMTALAKTVGVTRAEVSRRVKNIQKKMGLPPSVYMKSDHACARLKRK